MPHDRSHARLAALSREDSKRRTRILNEEPNDACECVEMGLPPPEHPDFTEHSPFCQVHVCYAREVGCCDPDFKRQKNGLEEAQNLPCSCLEGAFEWGWRRGCLRVERLWANVNGFADTCMTPLSGLAPIA
jgi:hypothetical protein